MCLKVKLILLISYLYYGQSDIIIIMLSDTQAYFFNGSDHKLVMHEISYCAAAMSCDMNILYPPRQHDYFAMACISVDRSRNTIIIYAWSSMHAL